MKEKISKILQPNAEEEDEKVKVQPIEVVEEEDLNSADDASGRLTR